MCKKDHTPQSLDIVIHKRGWFKYEITTIFYNQFGEDYARGQETAFSVKEVQYTIRNNIFWAVAKKGIDSDCIHVINNTNKYFNY